MSLPEHHGADAEAVEQQLREIRNEVLTEPLLSQPEALSLRCKLATEFRHDDVYYSQVLSLFNMDTANDAKRPEKKQYSTIRYARRDGNCFYRCAAFRLLELMLTDLSYADFCLAQVQACEKAMVSQFGEYSTDFSDVVKEAIDKIKRGVYKTPNDIYEAVISEVSGYFMVFLRYAVSVYLRAHSDDFLPFVMGLDYGTVEGYCSAEVEPIDHESDNVQLVAFAKIFHLTVTVETLDRTTTGQRITHVINAAADAPEAERPRHILYLLFRPGHYDLLEINSSAPDAAA